VISGNTSEKHGGGVFAADFGAIRNCTISGNSATNYGGGVYCYGTGTVRNTIIYFNTADAEENWYVSGTDVTFTYCCTTPTNGLPGGARCIRDKPKLMSTATGDYHLRYASPCIDAGKTLGSIVDDLDGNPRPIDGDFDGTNRYDIGAYEYNPAAADTDGDGRVDGDEVAMGFNPTYDENYAIDHVTNNPASYGLYTSNSIMGLSMGEMMLRISNGWLRLSLQLEQTDDLAGGAWSNAGDAVEWVEPAGAGKAFYRVRGGGE